MIKFINLKKNSEMNNLEMSKEIGVVNSTITVWTKKFIDAGLLN
jgi:predicted transcriptional regulator